MFKDVAMTDDELGHMIKKLLRFVDELGLQELPPLIYQLLLLAAKVGFPQVFLSRARR